MSEDCFIVLAFDKEHDFWTLDPESDGEVVMMTELGAKKLAARLRVDPLCSDYTFDVFRLEKVDLK